jgi:arylamine N-acetyltransferase
VLTQSPQRLPLEHIHAKSRLHLLITHLFRSRNWAAMIPNVAPAHIAPVRLKARCETESPRCANERTEQTSAAEPPSKAASSGVKFLLRCHHRKGDALYPSKSNTREANLFS